MRISCYKIFLFVSGYLSLWFWPSLEWTIIGGICVSRTHLVAIGIDCGLSFDHLKYYTIYIVVFFIFQTWEK